jgi:CHAT domain-containing protein
VIDPLRGTSRSLLYAALEGAAVRRCFREVTALEGAVANKAAVLDLAGRSAHLHLACHAEQSFKSLGKLLVADGEVLVSELGRSGAPTGLVVMSACETGLAGALTLGDEYIAFPATLVAFGAGAVVSTMWQVEDRAAVLVANRFYEGLRSGHSPARSLRLAQNWLRDADGPELSAACDAVIEGAPPSVATRMLRMWADRQRSHAGVRRYEHPLYWAPFFLTGTMGAPTEMRRV